jgi:UDP-glucose 4-epimerase
MYSRGSVIPLFVDQIKAEKPLTVTNPQMTRFLLPLSVAVDLVLFALKNGNAGDIFVRKAPASSVGELAQACMNIFKVNLGIKDVGIRAGEKIHETLVTQEELFVSNEFDDYFCIKGEHEMNYDEYFNKGHAGNIPPEGYTSANTTRLSIQEIEKLLLSLPEIQNALS